MQIESYTGRDLSRYRTENTVANFARVSSVDSILQAFNYANKHLLNVFVLGGGSNVFFCKKTVKKTLVIKNELPQSIIDIGNNHYQVSSSTQMMTLLEFAYKHSLAAPYYLASAPCQVGGAIAMNAGSGPKVGDSISAFLVSVKYLKNGKIVESAADELEFSYRHSKFLRLPNSFIISAVFKFLPESIEGNPIADRIKWAAANQDLSAPNCGSLCNTYYAPILKFVRILFWPLPAGLSFKKLNWAYNKSRSPTYLSAMLLLIEALHKLFLKKLKFEIRIVK